MRNLLIDLLAGVLFAQTPNDRGNQVAPHRRAMTPDERTAIGVPMMTAGQKLALDEWIDRYSSQQLRRARLCWKISLQISDAGLKERINLQDISKVLNCAAVD